ncbi:hypothetical protein NECAME_04822 [Necator americanus]|uniref:F-box domain-containing protein n=1 Tax=Necator americanus TaxID=51031 RepID=W2SMB5_NECAM|nr:hypothetical protein NECAME_04822 [Necator americanus]ETN70809.1 hypothetical protein NECAME_04822 [Necator americanus]
MSLGRFGLLPPELIRQICYNLTLDDILIFQKCHHFLEVMIDNVFFADMKVMRANCDAEGNTVSVSASSSSICFSTSSNWKEVMHKSSRINTLFIKRTEDAKDSYLLDIIERSEFYLLELEIHLLPGLQSSQHSKNNIYPRLTEFLTSCGRNLTRFRLEVGESNSIEYLHYGANATLIYSQDNDSLFQQQLVIPLFQALNEGRPCPSMLTLRVEWREKPVIALQTAFHAALPRSQRCMLQVLKLDFGSNVSTLSREEIQQILAQYAPYLNDTRRLQHLILDLSRSQLLASELEMLYSIVSRELQQTHRISLYTSEYLPKMNLVRKQMHTNRIVCS